MNNFKRQMKYGFLWSEMFEGSVNEGEATRMSTKLSSQIAFTFVKYKFILQKTNNSS